MNALHLSSRWGHSKTAQTLIDLGMNVETVNAVRFFQSQERYLMPAP